MKRSRAIRILLGAGILLLVAVVAVTIAVLARGSGLSYRMTFAIQSSPSDDLVKRVATVLEARLKSPECRGVKVHALGRDQIEIVVPISSEKSWRARQAYLAALKELEEGGIQPNEIHKLCLALELYVAKRQAKQIRASEVRDRRMRFDRQLDGFREKHLAHRAGIDKVVSTYAGWAEVRRGLDDPEALKRLIARGGVLEFRIAPTLPVAPGSGARVTELSKTEYETYLKQLAEEGPSAGRSRDEKYLWFPARGKSKDFSPDLVTGEYAGRKYVLLYDQRGYTMLNNPGNPSWSVSGSATRDAFGRPAVGFSLDARGAKMMSALTGAHKNHFLAILLDEEVYSAPIIQATIFDRAVIEGDFTFKEVGELVRIIEAASLPVRIDPNPVAEDLPVLPTGSK